MYNPERRLEPFTMGMTNGVAERWQLADGAYGGSHRGFGFLGGAKVVGGGRGRWDGDSRFVDSTLRNGTRS